MKVGWRSTIFVRRSKKEKVRKKKIEVEDIL